MSEAIRKFLIPVDSSVHSERALDYYLKNVHRPGDKVDFLHVEEMYSFPGNKIVFGPLLPDLNEHYQKSLQTRINESKDTVEKFRQKCEEHGVDCNVEVKSISDSPGEAICQAAKEYGSCGIVVGSRGLDVIRRTLLGSVSSYVVNHADVPVIVSRPPPKE